MECNEPSYNLDLEGEEIMQHNAGLLCCYCVVGAHRAVQVCIAKKSGIFQQHRGWYA